MSASRSLIRSSSQGRWICRDCMNTVARAHPALSQRRGITRNHIRKITIAQEEFNLRRDEIKQGKRKSMLDVLEERGYVNQIVGTREDLNRLLTEKRVGVYAGIDPTAPSLHVGHMVPFMALGWMYIHGYSATFLMGGFTASVGDPIGRLTGRAAQSTNQRTANSVAMHQQLKSLGASMEHYAQGRGFSREWSWRRALLNNYAWWEKLSVKDFLRILGAGTRIGPMLGRDTVKNRLDAGEGMSFAEFTYPLCQAWDWWHMYQTGTQIQIGGADQFGNILAGAEAVRYMARNDPTYVAEQQRQEEAMQSDDGTRKIHEPKDDDFLKDPMGFTVPLLTTASGEKFGKSAGNAIWLDRNMTSSFDLYQFFLRSADADVERYLKLFTFLPIAEIENIMTEQRKDESKRVAQHKLAAEFVELVHGKTAAREAENQHRQLFDKELTLGDIKAQIKASQEVLPPTTSDGRPIDMNPLVNKTAKPYDMHSAGVLNIKLPESLVVEQPLSRILWSAGLVASRSEGQRMINNKGVYLGGRKGKDTLKPMSDTLNFAQAEDGKWASVKSFVLEGNLLILRTGKWRIKVVNIVSDDEFEAEGITCPGWKEDQQATSDPDLKAMDLHGEELHQQVALDNAKEHARHEDDKRKRLHRQQMLEQQNS